MDIGVFIPIGNNGWLISTNSPQYMPTFELNKQIVLKADGSAPVPVSECDPGATP